MNEHSTALEVSRVVLDATARIRNARELRDGCVKAARTHWHSMVDWTRWENPEKAADQRRKAIMWLREARRWHNSMLDAMEADVG